MEDEPTVDSSTPLPRGYTFLRKGNVYRTKHARRLAHAAGLTIYRVINNSHTRSHRASSSSSSSGGIRVPTSIARRVQAMDESTRSQRHAAVSAVDAAWMRRAEEACRAAFPRMPLASVDRALGHALKKRSGRVGRSRRLDVAVRVRLAVRAHLRHEHTDYDALLAAGVEKREARRRVQSAVDEAVREWGGMVDGDAGEASRRQSRESSRRRMKEKKDGLRRALLETRRKKPKRLGTASMPICIDEDDDGSSTALSQSRNKKVKVIVIDDDYDDNSYR